MVVSIPQDERDSLAFRQAEAGSDCASELCSWRFHKYQSRTCYVIFATVDGCVELQRQILGLEDDSLIMLSLFAIAEDFSGMLVLCVI